MTIIDKISEKLGGKHHTQAEATRAPTHGEFQQASASGPEETGYDKTERRKGMGEKVKEAVGLDPKDAQRSKGSGVPRWQRRGWL
jgi:hypothetical protein